MSVSAVQLDHFGTVAVRHRDCPLCGRNNDDVKANRYSYGPWAIRDCSSCGFVYIDAAIPYDLQFKEMAWERTTKVEEKRRAEIRPISYKVSRWTRFRLHILPKRTMLKYIASRTKGGNVLDLGCGNGHALMNFPPEFTPFGVEISSELAEAANDYFAARGGYAVNAPCTTGLLKFPPDFFAAASLRSYLEHEAEPLTVLKNLYRVLKEGGIAVVKVPNYGSVNRAVMGAKWCGFRYPDHLNYFTPASLVKMAGEAGFETRFGLTGRLPTSDNMWAILTKRAKH